MEMPNKAPRMMVDLLQLGRVMVVIVLSWDRMMVRLGTVWLRLVVLLCNLRSIVFGLVCERWRCGVFWCVLMV